MSDCTARLQAMGRRERLMFELAKVIFFLVLCFCGDVFQLGLGAPLRPSLRKPRSPSPGVVRGPVEMDEEIQVWSVLV